MFLYELVNSTRKFTIVAEIVSLLKKIYKRDAPFRAVFKVKTLAVLFSAYPCEMKHIPRNLNLPPFWRYLVSIFWRYLGAIHSHTRGLSMRTHLTAGVGPARWRPVGPDFLVLTKRSAASGDENVSAVLVSSRTSFRLSCRRVENVSILLLFCLDKCSNRPYFQLS